MNKEMELNDRDLMEFKEFLYDRENSQATIQKYMTDIKSFYKYIGNKKSVQKKDLLEYKQWLMERYAVSSANSMIVALNQYLLFKDAAELRIKRIKVQKQDFLKDEKNLSRKEYKLLLETALKKGNEQLAYIMETIAATGIRISEPSSFTVEKVKSGRIEVMNKGKSRIVLLPGKLRLKLMKFAKKNGIRKGPIFVTKSGKPKNRSNIWAEMKKLQSESGVEGNKIFPHNLRHLFARCYYQNTKDLTGLADLLGHSSLEVTRIYTIEPGIEFQRKVEKLGLIS